MKHYALLGEKLSHSYSKVIHEYLFQKLKINADYTLWELDPKNISKALSIAKEKNLSGFNITLPYKESLLSQIPMIDSSAQTIGAINTVSLSEEIKAYNTDYFGFQKMLEFFEVDTEGKRAVILGTGGAAKAVAEALQKMNINSLTYVSRNPKKENQVSYQNIPEGDFIINATPIGMYPYIEESPISKEIFTKFSLAIDIIYNPFETKFLKEAKEQKLFTINGLFMFVAQAIQAETIWQKKTFDKELYYEVYRYLEGIIYENYVNQRS